MIQWDNPIAHRFAFYSNLCSHSTRAIVQFVMLSIWQNHNNSFSNISVALYLYLLHVIHFHVTPTPIIIPQKLEIPLLKAQPHTCPANVKMKMSVDEWHANSFSSVEIFPRTTTVIKVHKSTLLIIQFDCNKYEYVSFTLNISSSARRPFAMLSCTMAIIVCNLLRVFARRCR